MDDAAQHYYNEWEQYPAQWLRNLANGNEIPTGLVDETDIRKVRADDVRDFTQAHFFAGIGGWPIALELAGWPTDRPVWTGSCPCQPFSSAGRRKGEADERHLWPDFYKLISECRPATVFGEQVADADGREWFSGIRADLEAVGYAVGAADLCAAGVNAPHIRQRIFWVADRESQRYAWREDGNQAGPQREAGSCGQDEGLRITELSNAHQEYQDAEFEGSNAKRRIGTGVLPLVDGLLSRSPQVRAYGNSIAPQVGALFVKAFMDVENTMQP